MDKKVNLNFSKIWWDILEDRMKPVQNRSELEQIFNIMIDLKPSSYLEVGTAEGDSLYALGQTVADGGMISFVDLGEFHTTPLRNKRIGWLTDMGYTVEGYIGNSMDFDVVARVREDGKRFDVVMIDAGHKYEEVKSDWENYGDLANKAVIFHDINMKAVRKLWEEVKQWATEKNFQTKEIISPDKTDNPEYGFGVLLLW